MIRIVLIEDEPAAARRIKRLILELRKEWLIVGTADSVETSVSLINQGGFDLIFSDIQLSDGVCFDVFKASNTTKPIIFITAYDKFAVQAFEFNSIHYLLKPIKREQLLVAIEKFEKNEIQNFAHQVPNLEVSIRDANPQIVSKVGNKTVLISIDDIALIISENRVVKALLFSSKKHLVDYTLDKLEGYLPTDQFFRISRQMIVNRNAVKRFDNHSSNRLLLNTTPAPDGQVVVSKEKTPKFRSWITPKP